MTIRDLYKLRNIRATIHVVLTRVEVLDRYGQANDGAKKALAASLAELYEQEIDAEEELRRFIGNVDDPEIREIIRLRFLNGLPWVDVAAEVTPLEKDATRNAPLMKVRRFLNNFPEKG